MWCLHGMLSALLFVGSSGRTSPACRERWPISCHGRGVSSFLVGGATYGLVQFITAGSCPSSTACFSGALISPTDPIAVLGILKLVGASKKLIAHRRRASSTTAPAWCCSWSC